jgi:hypothetical protein
MRQPVMALIRGRRQKNSGAQCASGGIADAATGVRSNTLRLRVFSPAREEAIRRQISRSGGVAGSERPGHARGLADAAVDSEDIDEASDG